MQNMTTFRTFFITLMLLSATLIYADNGVVVNLWQNNMPEDNGDPSDIPFMKVFLPDANRSAGRAVLIIPGGEYDKLNIENEGYGWIPFFKKMGITAVVLKYRLPNGNKNVPIADAERAMALLRANASQWNIKRNEIGVMGFSAGGHLASYLATHYQNETKPDFQILMYPVITMMDGFANKEARRNFLGESPKKKTSRLYSNDMHVTRITPRALIMLSDDDPVVTPSNGVNYYNELYRHDVPASLYVFPAGGHGWGMDESFDHHIEMQLLLKAWFASF